MSWLLRLFASVTIAIRSVLRNKLRAGLTIVGITIGIAAVVTMTAIAAGARTQIGGHRMLLFSREHLVLTGRKPSLWFRQFLQGATCTDRMPQRAGN